MKLQDQPPIPQPIAVRAILIALTVGMKFGNGHYEEALFACLGDPENTMPAEAKQLVRQVWEALKANAKKQAGK